MLSFSLSFNETFNFLFYFIIDPLIIKQYVAQLPIPTSLLKMVLNSDIFEISIFREYGDIILLNP